MQLSDHSKLPAVDSVDIGEPGEGEVLVDMTYAGVNPVDAYAAQGKVAPDAPLPRVLGGEGAGTVRGRPVLVAGGGLGSRRNGVWAEAAVVPEMAVIPLPVDIDPQQVAALGVAGLTAFHVVGQVGQVGPEDRVLVLGASGGVGGPIISFAASTGATVVGQTGSAHKAHAIRQSGASDVIVSDADGLVDAARALRPTVIIDPLGGGFTAAALEAVTPRGRVVVYGTSAGADVSFNLQQVYRSSKRLLGYGGLGLTDEERREGLEQTLRIVAEGRMSIRIDRVLPLEQVGDAFDLITSRGLSGKVLLDCTR
ncbi:MAG TPA: zinc-binding alcohol dehydrogenase family protein [Frankiaceae bacterium]|nr:zinc-binding alcohol dehydrogenase family protein [Frankiaceae bacterium]